MFTDNASFAPKTILVSNRASKLCVNIQVQSSCLTTADISMSTPSTVARAARSSHHTSCRKVKLKLLTKFQHENLLRSIGRSLRVSPARAPADEVPGKVNVVHRTRAFMRRTPPCIVLTQRSRSRPPLEWDRPTTPIGPTRPTSQRHPVHITAVHVPRPTR